jgi:hypothetical protein
MKPVTTVVVFLLAVIAVAHVLRLLFQIGIVVNGTPIPQWASVVGLIVAASLAFLLWRENRK